MAQLIVKKEDGSILFDTSKITYGLVKSGYLTFVESWTRKGLRSAQLDPNDGANWSKTTTSPAEVGTYLDATYGFTVTGARSPIVFITGRGCLIGSKVSGSSITFQYANIDVGSTKFYCFDLMQDIYPGGPYLKTWNDDGQITFNSLQPPLNVVAAIQAPPYEGSQNAQYPQLHSKPYVGAVYFRQQLDTPGKTAQLVGMVDIPLWPGVEYAAYLPWSRGCMIRDNGTGQNFPAYQYSGSEGCAGRIGGIQFQFGPAPGTPQSIPWVGPGVAMPPIISQVSTDRYPVALVITTANLPFPFN